MRVSCMVQWFVQSISNRNIAVSIPAEYGFKRLSSHSLPPGGYQQPNVYVSVHVVGEKNEGIVTGQNQPLRAAWCKTRLLNSGG